MNWAVGFSREQLCATIGRTGGTVLNFLWIFGIP